MRINLEEMSQFEIVNELKAILRQLDPISANEIARELLQEFPSIEELRERIKQINE